MHTAGSCPVTRNPFLRVRYSILYTTQRQRWRPNQPARDVIVHYRVTKSRLYLLNLMSRNGATLRFKLHAFIFKLASASRRLCQFFKSGRFFLDINKVQYGWQPYYTHTNNLLPAAPLIMLYCCLCSLFKIINCNNSQHQQPTLAQFPETGELRSTGVLFLYQVLFISLICSARPLLTMSGT